MTDLVGRTLCERYHVLSLIGRGGMADVYRVRDRIRTTDLAMKLLREDLAQDRVFLRRFKREANNLARLQHPNIVRFYGLEQEGPQAFILMEYVEGISLRREIFDLDGTPMDDSRILEILRTVCSALNFAHHEGIVHCDLKPGNVMIQRNGTVLVTDFGVARMMDAATVTLVGAGTPPYMAPELVKGKEPLPQTDIYALGVILFEMLTGGERPFTGELASITGSTGEKVRWEHLGISPPSPRKWNHAIFPELEQVLLRCLEKVPRDRYSSAIDLVEKLEKTLYPLDEPGITNRAKEGGIEANLRAQSKPETQMEVNAVSFKDQNAIELDNAEIDGLLIAEGEIAITIKEPLRDKKMVAEWPGGVVRSLKKPELRGEQKHKDTQLEADHILAKKILVFMIAGILLTFIGLSLLG